MIKTLLKSVLMGGAVKKMQTGNTGNMFLFLFIVIVDLFIRTLVVNIAYNMLIPKLIATTSSNPEKVLSNFRPLTFWESLLLIILVSSLIR